MWKKIGKVLGMGVLWALSHPEIAAQVVTLIEAAKDAQKPKQP